MTNKEYLQSYARQQAIVAMYEATKADALKELERLPTIPQQTDTGILQRKLIKELRDTIELCDARSAEARQKCEEIRSAINSVQDYRQRTILEMRYIQEPPETWERIADRLNYTFEHCHNLHRQALKNIKQRP